VLFGGMAGAAHGGTAKKHCMSNGGVPEKSPSSVSEKAWGKVASKTRKAAVSLHQRYADRDAQRDQSVSVNAAVKQESQSVALHTQGPASPDKIHNNLSPQKKLTRANTEELYDRSSDKALVRFEALDTNATKEDSQFVELRRSLSRVLIDKSDSPPGGPSKVAEEDAVTPARQRPRSAKEEKQLVQLRRSLSRVLTDQPEDPPGEAAHCVPSEKEEPEISQLRRSLSRVLQNQPDAPPGDPAEMVVNGENPTRASFCAMEKEKRENEVDDSEEDSCSSEGDGDDWEQEHGYEEEQKEQVSALRTECRGRTSKRGSHFFLLPPGLLQSGLSTVRESRASSFIPSNDSNDPSHLALQSAAGSGPQGRISFAHRMSTVFGLLKNGVPGSRRSAPAAAVLEGGPGVDSVSAVVPVSEADSTPAPKPYSLKEASEAALAEITAEMAKNGEDPDDAVKKYGLDNQSKREQQSPSSSSDSDSSSSDEMGNKTILSPIQASKCGSTASQNSQTDSQDNPSLSRTTTLTGKIRKSMANLFSTGVSNNEPKSERGAEGSRGSASQAVSEPKRMSEKKRVFSLARANELAKQVIGQPKEDLEDNLLMSPTSNDCVLGGEADTSAKGAVQKALPRSMSMNEEKLAAPNLRRCDSIPAGPYNDEAPAAPMVAGDWLLAPNSVLRLVTTQTYGGMLGGAGPSSSSELGEPMPASIPSAGLGLQLHPDLLKHRESTSSDTMSATDSESTQVMISRVLGEVDTPKRSSVGKSLDDAMSKSSGGGGSCSDKGSAAVSSGSHGEDSARLNSLLRQTSFGTCAAKNRHRRKKSSILSEETARFRAEATSANSDSSRSSSVSRGTAMERLHSPLVTRGAKAEDFSMRPPSAPKGDPPSDSNSDCSSTHVRRSWRALTS